MPTITIQGTVIDFPDTGSSPDWSQAVIEFAEAVESALALSLGPADVSPQVMNIDAYNSPGNIDITNLSFSTTAVRGSLVRYTVYRSTTTTVAYEIGEMQLIYNTDGATWVLTRTRTGDAKISFSVTSDGQIQFNPEALGGINHAGKISYAATAMLQS